MFIYTLDDIVGLAILAIIVVALAIGYALDSAEKVWKKLKGRKP